MKRSIRILIAAVSLGLVAGAGVLSADDPPDTESGPVVQTMTIVETGHGFLVRPSFVIAEDGSLVRFVNLTVLEARIADPAGLFQEPSEETWRRLIASDPDLRAAFDASRSAGAVADGLPTIPPGGVQILEISAGSRRGSVPFQVYLSSGEDERGIATRGFARGESAPHVIIE